MPNIPASQAAPIIERAPLPMVEVQGADHLISHVNAAFCRLLGKTRAELVGRPMCEIAPGGATCQPLLDEVYQTGQSVTATVDDGHEDADTWLYAMWPALDPLDRPQGVIIGVTRVPNARQTLTDVNEALLIAGLREHASKELLEGVNTQLQAEVGERKRAELGLREANEQLAGADRNKDQFLAMLAHELRNPLAPIRNAAHILRLAASADPAVVRAQEIIERQADHLVKLVDQLLDVSRIEQGKVTLQREDLNLAKAVARALEACEPLIAAQHHTIDLQQPAEPLHVDGDRTRIDQILMNLIGNAAKYTRSGGTIHVTLAREGDQAVFRIRDNGIGIDPADLGRIFDLFTQLEPAVDRGKGGLGLGLNLVKELVALHGGEVEARSEGLGHGSEFVVRLPALDNAARAPRPPTVEAPAITIIPSRILVVDDNPDSRETMELLLEADGHHVDLAEDGEQAVAMARDGHHDVAFVDIGLPKLDGYGVAREIRRQPGGDRIVLIALSGYGQDEDKRKALAAGFDAHLTKPARLAAIQQLLGELDRFRR